MQYKNPWADDPYFVDLGEWYGTHDLYVLYDPARPIKKASFGMRCSDVEERYTSCPGWSILDCLGDPMYLETFKRFLEYLQENAIYPPLPPYKE